MRATGIAALLLVALLLPSIGAAADPATHWRTYAGRVAAAQVDNAKGLAQGVAVPQAPDVGGVLADAPGAAERAKADAEAAVEQAAPVLPSLPALPGVPSLPGADDAVAKGKAIAQHWLTYAVRIVERHR
jgi:hypothetical protein